MNRRGLLKALCGLPVAAVGGAVAATPSKADVSPEVQRLIDQLERTEAKFLANMKAAGLRQFEEQMERYRAYRG